MHREGTQPRHQPCSRPRRPPRLGTAGGTRGTWVDAGTCGRDTGSKWRAWPGASHLPEVALAPATTAAAGSLTVSAPPLTVA